MTEIDLNKYITEYKELIDTTSVETIKTLNIPEKLKKSMIYSVQAGGKRIRPLLLFSSYQAYQDNVDKVLSTAIALELVHTYSLIHDDLPAMDDDDLRRGKLTNHKVFDEATAILAGDALLTYSFELISMDDYLTNAEKVEVIKLLSKSSGPSGMVAGQVLDMTYEMETVDIGTLEKIHELKTGQLLSFAIEAGAYLAKAPQKDIAHLKSFAYYLGLIFQVQDDILDVTGDSVKMGKRVGSDAENDKSTYPQLLGLEGAKKQKMLYEEKAILSLSKTTVEHPFLKALTQYVTDRVH